MIRPSGSPPARTYSLRELIIRQIVFTLIVLVSFVLSISFLLVQIPAPASPSAHAVLILVWDGVRPDMIANTLTPNLVSLGKQGVVGVNHHAVFPTTALVNTAALTFGDLPGSTAHQGTGDGSGITSLPADGTGVLSDRPFYALPTPGTTTTTGGSSIDLSRPATQLQLQSQLSGGIMQSPSLVDRAIQKGETVALLGTGGTALLPALRPVQNGAPHLLVVDDSYTYPATLVASQPQSSDPAPVSRALTTTYINQIIPKLPANAPSLTILQMPDVLRVARASGLGSAAMTAALSAQDSLLGEIENALRSAGLLANTNIIVTSPSGMNAVAGAAGDSGMVHLADLLTREAARGKDGALDLIGAQGISSGPVTADTTALVVAQGGADAIYLPDTMALATLARQSGKTADQTRGQIVRQIVQWLQTFPLVGPIFQNEAFPAIAGTIPMGKVGISGDRAPALVITFTASSQAVAGGLANLPSLQGTTYADTSGELATNGGFNRRDLQPILYIAGPSIITGGAQETAPTSVADIAQTVAVLLNLDTNKTGQGRVLSEILRNSTIPNLDIVENDYPGTVVQINGTYYLADVVVDTVNGIPYFRGAAVARSQTESNPAILTLQAHDLALQ